VLQCGLLIPIAAASKRLNLTILTVTTSLRRLEKLGIVRKTTGCKHRRLHGYDRCLKILNTESVGKYRP
jgi:DNA-binding Lrp family transcriptional regulator